jgi:hypothetical protein
VNTVKMLAVPLDEVSYLTLAGIYGINICMHICTTILSCVRVTYRTDFGLDVWI